MRGPRMQGPTRVTLAPTVCTIETEGFGMNVPFVMGGILFPSTTGPWVVTLFGSGVAANIG